MVPLFKQKFDQFDILEELKIKHAFERSKVVELVRICQPELKSKHVFICAPGFMQQYDDHAETWRHVHKHYKNAEVYALTWTSCHYSDIFGGGLFANKEGKSKKKVLLNVANTWYTGRK